jgi:MFS family permease
MAVGTLFFVLGVAVGSWVARIPEIQAALHLGDGELGLALLMSAFGAMIAMPTAGRVAPRVGTRRLAWGAALAMCAILPLIPLSGRTSALMAALAAYGAATGVLGVAINALALHVEELVGRPILSSFHGLFSLGGLVGAAGAAALIALGIGPVASLAGTAAVLAAALLVAIPHLSEALPGPPARGRTGLRRDLLVLGGLAFLGFVGEGSMADWSAVYLRQSLRAPASVAALGFAAYSLGMTSARFLGDRLSRTFSDGAMLRGGAGLAASGLIAALALRHPAAAILGFGLVGAGLANVVPVLFRAAARAPGVGPVAGIATASTIGYLGFLAGPPVIGGVADLASLPIALCLVAAGIAIVAACGGIINDFDAPTEADDATPRFDRHESPIAPAAEG